MSLSTGESGEGKRDIEIHAIDEEEKFMVAFAPTTTTSSMGEKELMRKSRPKEGPFKSRTPKEDTP